MSDKIDVQMHTLGVTISYPLDRLDENFPMQLNLTNEEACELACDMEDARLAILGIAQHEVTARDLQVGDIFGDTGLVVRSVTTMGDMTRVEFQGHQSMTVRATLTMTVNRSIQ